MGDAKAEVAYRPSPGRALLVAALGCLVVCALAVAARAAQPTLGLGLEAAPSANVVRLTSTRGAAREVAAPGVLVRVAAGDRAVDLTPSDLIEEPDFFDTYPEMAEFFRRQSALHAILTEDEVTLTIARPGQPLATHRIAGAPRDARWSELPAVFWFQVVAAAVAFLVSVWALVLRPRSLPVRVFAAMGASIPIFVLPAAIYGTRELAIDGGVFRVLSSLNHTGANLFGIALVAFFLSYPAPLVRPRRLWLVPALFVPWLLLDITRLAPDQNLGSRAPIFLEMIAALVLGVAQLRATRGDPRARAGLLWLGVSVLLGASLFVFGVVGSTVLGWFPPISQGYSFGFFLLMHVSFAFGLGRHRLFELGEWAYAILLWVLAGLAVIAVDVVLVVVLEQNRALSAGVAILVCGFVYLPLRNWLWTKAVSRRVTPEHELFDAVLQVTFAADSAERTRLWRSLLEKLFDPTTMTARDEEVVRATVRDEGLVLVVPGAAAIPAHELSYPWRGKGLFGRRHAELAEQLVTLLRHAESRREAFERGVRDERSRIARDMHDDVGANLLSTLHRKDLEATRDGVRQAIGDVRAIVHELTRREMTLDDVLADVRAETMQRLEGAGLTVDWPLPPRSGGAPLAHGVYRHVTSILRELTSNAIRHAGASRVRVRVELARERLVITFADDGEGFDPASVPRRSGLDNLERRASALAGALSFSREAGETVARVELPIV